MVRPSLEKAGICKMDILCGREFRAQNHEGNIIFRQLVSRAASAYAKNGRQSKSCLVNTLHRFVAQKGMRFVKLDDYGYSYAEIANKVARKKVAHAFRDQKTNFLARGRPVALEFQFCDENMMREWERELSRLRLLEPVQFQDRPPPKFVDYALAGTIEEQREFSRRRSPSPSTFFHHPSPKLRENMSVSFKHGSETQKTPAAVNAKQIPAPIFAESELTVLAASTNEQPTQMSSSMHYNLSKEQIYRSSIWSTDSISGMGKGDGLAVVSTHQSTFASAPASLTVGSFTGCSRSDAIGIMEALRRAVEAKREESPPILIVIKKWLNSQGKGWQPRVELGNVLAVEMPPKNK
jgi:hypothetical protein